MYQQKNDPVDYYEENIDGEWLGNNNFVVTQMFSSFI